MLVNHIGAGSWLLLTRERSVSGYCYDRSTEFNDLATFVELVRSPANEDRENAEDDLDPISPIFVVHDKLFGQDALYRQVRKVLDLVHDYRVYDDEPN